MQASAALDPINAMEASRRASRKRAISASPYSEMDLSTLIRYSPTALHLLNGGSPTSSGSYGHLSPGALSPALVHSAHLQQLQVNNKIEYLFYNRWRCCSFVAVMKLFEHKLKK
jgi:hypothetical protein